MRKKRTIEGNEIKEKSGLPSVSFFLSFVAGGFLFDSRTPS